MARPGLGRPGLARPGLTRPGLSRPGLARQEHVLLGQPWRTDRNEFEQGNKLEIATYLYIHIYIYIAACHLFSSKEILKDHQHSNFVII